MDENWPAEVEVVVEVPRGGFVKRRTNGAIAFVSPLPCPFNYGSVPGSHAADGDPADAVVLGPRLERGHHGTWPVRAVVRFTDAGRIDDKLVCGPPLRQRDCMVLKAFFSVYALAKRTAGRLAGETRPTLFGGLVFLSG